ncbi:MAG TPA: glycosyltransferase family 39 protein [Nevskiaceae bacterium]|nr:glycosyltransferase family 39 protein [Nevskiaceae bacterium]
MPTTSVGTPPRPWFGYTVALIVILTIYRGLVVYYGHLDLYVDEAQYWTWSQHLTWGYYSKPPVLALLIAFTTWIGGNGVFWVKAGALIAYPISALLLYALARRLFDPRIAFWSAAAFILLPGVSLSSMIISTDVPFFLFWCLGLYAYWRALENDRWSWWLLAGVAGGLGLQTKYTMILFVLSVVLYLASDPRLRQHFKSPKLYVTMLIAALIFLPNLLWNAANDWPSLQNVTNISHLESNPGLHWNHLSDFLGAQFAVMGPIFFGIWLWLTLWRPSRWWKDDRLRFLQLFAIPFLVTICIVSLFGRANANWGAMTYASATIVIVAMRVAREPQLRRSAWRWFVAGLAINFVLMPTVYHLDWWTHEAGITLTRHNDPFKRVRGWSAFAAEARAFMQQHPNAIPLADDRGTVAELKYYARPAGRRTLEWNPAGTINDQYTLKPTLDGKQGKDFLYFTHHKQLAANLRASFDTTTWLGAIHIPVDKGFARDYSVWFLKNFKGYQPSRGAVHPALRTDRREVSPSLQRTTLGAGGRHAGTRHGTDPGSRLRDLPHTVSGR